MFKKQLKGFTLVELLVYVAIFAVVSGLMIGILTTTLKVNQRESASAEATSQLNFILQTIQRLVRESSAIIVNSSTSTDVDAEIGSQQNRLVLRMKDSVGDNSTDRDPIIIYVENNIIKMSEGKGTYQRISDLTNSRVLADNLKFTKYTQYPGHDTVSVDIQLTYNSQNPDSRVSRTLRTAIARVSAATFDSNLLPGTDNQYEIGYSGSNLRWKNISISNLISTSNLLNLGQLAIDPITDVQNGSIYYNTASSTFRGYKNNVWANLGGSDLWTASSTAIYYNTGNVGIGTTAPETKLNVAGVITSSNMGRFKGWTAGGETGAAAEIGMSGGVAYLYNYNRSTNSHGNLQIGDTPGGVFINSFDNGGNVGIATTTPASKLTVAGTIESTTGGIKFPDGTTQTTATQYKVGGFTRDLTLAAGTQAVTGVGFAPKAIFFMASVGGVPGRTSWGISDGTTSRVLFDHHPTYANSFNLSTVPIYLTEVNGVDSYGALSSFDSDGFTISWTKIGSPTGTATIFYMAFR